MRHGRRARCLAQTSLNWKECLCVVVHYDRLCFDAGVTLDTEQSVVLSSLRNAGNLQLLLSWCLSPDQTPRNQARRMPSLKKQQIAEPFQPTYIQ